MHYTDDSSQQGWFPRGLSDHTDRTRWQHNFKHPRLDIEPWHGEVVNVAPPEASMDRARRQEWIYTATYKDGTTHDFRIACKSLELGVNIENIEQRLRDLPHQPFYVKKEEKTKEDVLRDYAQPEVREKELECILSLLVSRGAPQKYVDEWMARYASFPESASTTIPFDNHLLKLLEEFGGAVQVPLTPAASADNRTILDPVYVKNSGVSKKIYEEQRKKSQNEGARLLMRQKPQRKSNSSKKKAGVAGVVATVDTSAAVSSTGADTAGAGLSTDARGAAKVVQRAKSSMSKTKSSEYDDSEESEDISADDDNSEDDFEDDVHDSDGDDNAPIPESREILPPAPLTVMAPKKVIYASAISFTWLDDDIAVYRDPKLFMGRRRLYVRGVCMAYADRKKTKIYVKFPALDKKEQYLLDEDWYQTNGQSDLPEQCGELLETDLRDEDDPDLYPVAAEDAGEEEEKEEPKETEKSTGGGGAAGKRRKVAAKVAKTTAKKAKK